MQEQEKERVDPQRVSVDVAETVARRVLERHDKEQAVHVRVAQRHGKRVHGKLAIRVNAMRETRCARSLRMCEQLIRNSAPSTNSHVTSGACRRVTPLARPYPYVKSAWASKRMLVRHVRLGGCRRRCHAGEHTEITEPRLTVSLTHCGGV